MADVDEIDQKTAAIARTKLHAFLDGNPPAEKAAEAHRMLAMLPSPVAPPREHSDAELGLENQINDNGEANLLNTKPSQDERDAAAVARTASPIKPQTELEGDPSAQEILGQAMTMPLLHMIGLGLSGSANAILDSKGGQAARLLRSTEAAGGDAGAFNPEAIVQSGSMKGAKAGDAVAHLERLKANGGDVERELEGIYSDAHMPTPGVEAAKAALKFRPPSAYESVHALHGNPVAVASAGMHVLPPIMGRLTVPAEIAKAAGSGIAAPESSFFSSPIMQAVMNGQASPPMPQQPTFPPGGTR